MTLPRLQLGFSWVGLICLFGAAITGAKEIEILPTRVFVVTSSNLTAYVENYHKVKRGMTLKEVRALLGAPCGKPRNSQSNINYSFGHYTYKHLPSEDVGDGIFTITIDPNTQRVVNQGAPGLHMMTYDEARFVLNVDAGLQVLNSYVAWACRSVLVINGKSMDDYSIEGWLLDPINIELDLTPLNWRSNERIRIRLNCADIPDGFAALANRVRNSQPDDTLFREISWKFGVDVQLLRSTLVEKKQYELGDLGDQSRKKGGRVSP